MSMSRNTQQEHLGYAFVRAIAYAAGYSCTRPEVDDDSIDLTIAKRGPGGTVRSPRLELQIKCTGVGPLQEPERSFQLSLKNHDDLRHIDFQVPRILVVVLVPTKGEPQVWLKQTDQQLSIKHSGYWLSLRGQPAYTGTAKEPKITVKLQKKQRFDVRALTAMMDRVALGELP